MERLQDTLYEYFQTVRSALNNSSVSVGITIDSYTCYNIRRVDLETEEDKLFFIYSTIKGMWVEIEKIRNENTKPLKIYKLQYEVKESGKGTVEDVYNYVEKQWKGRDKNV